MTPGREETVVLVNDQRLTRGQVETMRVALEGFWQQMRTEGLGEDALGHRLAAHYSARAAEVLGLLLGLDAQPPGDEAEGT